MEHLCNEFNCRKPNYTRTIIHMKSQSPNYSSSNISKERGVKLDSEQLYEHVPKSEETSHEGKLTVSWNQQVQTDKTIPNNKPDIIIHDNEKGICVFKDDGISGDRNAIKKEASTV